MRAWVLLSCAGVGLLALTALFGLSDNRPILSVPVPEAGLSVGYPPRTLPQQTRLTLQDAAHADLWHSGLVPRAEVIRRASYLEFGLPGGRTYAYRLAGGDWQGLGDLRVWVGDRITTLDTLVRNRGYALDTAGELVARPN